MSLLLEIIVIYIKDNIITKLLKLYSPPRNSRVGNKSPVLFVKKLCCTGNLFIERSDSNIFKHLFTFTLLQYFINNGIVLKTWLDIFVEISHFYMNNVSITVL